ncbi:MAG: hypothetical protein IJZ61_08180 [Oscillospiraceae bacterium]|nr:hypothetical protein [Oscillospiraceae bacterium]
MNDNGIFRAEQRVKEMNRMAQQYVRQGNNYMNSNNRQQVQPRFEPVPQLPPPPERKSVQQPAMPKRQEVAHPQFMLDNEKLLIILIMYLLIKEKADIKLIAALAYLLL